MKHANPGVKEKKDQLVKFCQVRFLKVLYNFYYNEEFDPGSGWTLAGGLTHASRGASRGSNTLVATGARVSNAYATYLLQEDSFRKRKLILHTDT